MHGLNLGKLSNLHLAFVGDGISSHHLLSVAFEKEARVFLLEFLVSLQDYVYNKQLFCSFNLTNASSATVATCYKYDPCRSFEN